MTGFEDRTQGRAMRLLAGLSLPGLVLGTLFFSASLAPSLLPRGFALQGVLSGCSFAAGYGGGVFLAWLWTYLELPVLPPPRLATLTRVGRAACLLAGLSLPGLVLGTLFFSASLAPSLLPRGFALQGVLSGCSFAAGYGVGVFLAWLWTYLELPVLPPPRLATLKRVGLAACLLA